MSEHLCIARDACEPLAAAVVPRANGNDKWIYKRLYTAAVYSARVKNTHGAVQRRAWLNLAFFFRRFQKIFPAKRGLVNGSRKKTMRSLDLTQLRPSVKSTARFNTSPCHGGPYYIVYTRRQIIVSTGRACIITLICIYNVWCAAMINGLRWL